MDILRNLFGNLTSGIIRLAVAAGILFLGYLFIVKPVLNTAGDVTDKAFKSSGLDEIGKTLKDVNVQVQPADPPLFQSDQAQRRSPAEADPLHQARRRRRQQDRTLYAALLDAARWPK